MVGGTAEVLQRYETMTRAPIRWALVPGILFIAATCLLVCDGLR